MQKIERFAPTVGKFANCAGTIVASNNGTTTLDLDAYGRHTYKTSDIKPIAPLVHNLQIGDQYITPYYAGIFTVSKIAISGMVLLSQGDKAISLPLEEVKKLPKFVPNGVVPTKAKDYIHDQIDKLIAEKNALLSSGAIAPDGVWIEYGKVHNRDFIQAYLRSREPIFNGRKRKYLGKADDPKVSAVAQNIARRNQLIQINKRLNQLNALL